MRKLLSSLLLATTMVASVSCGMLEDKEQDYIFGYDGYLESKSSVEQTKKKMETIEKYLNETISADKTFTLHGKSSETIYKAQAMYAETIKKIDTKVLYSTMMDPTDVLQIILYRIENGGKSVVAVTTFVCPEKEEDK